MKSTTCKDLMGTALHTASENKMRCSPEFVKEDINFMECALWIPNERYANSCLPGYIWTDNKGYTYRCGYKPASRIDRVFLYTIFYMCQQNNFSDRLSTTCAAILKNAEIHKNSRNYDRLKESLERWVNITVKFSGTFYTGSNTRVTIQFGIIDNWEIDEKTKKLKIRLNEKFMLHIKNSKYCQYVNLAEIKKIQSPVALRLLELLHKSFLKSNVFKIDSQKLATKMILGKTRASHIRIEIEEAVAAVNKHINRVFTLEYEHKGVDDILFIFKDATPKQKKMYIIPDPSDIIIQKEKKHLVLDKSNIVYGSTGYEIYDFFEDDKIIRPILENKSVWKDIKEFCNNSDIPIGEHFYRLKYCLLDVKNRIENPKTRSVANRIGFTRTLLKGISLEKELELSDIRNIETFKNSKKVIPTTDLINGKKSPIKLNKSSKSGGSDSPKNLQEPKPKIILPIKRRR